MSDEITVGHYASYSSRMFDLIEDLQSDAQTLQQVIFERDKVIAELREELKAAQSDQGWISVEDRLPEKDNEYNVVILGGVSTRWFAVDIGFVDEPPRIDPRISHWRELPQPPKVKG